MELDQLLCASKVHSHVWPEGTVLKLLGFESWSILHGDTVTMVVFRQGAGGLRLVSLTHHNLLEHEVYVDLLSSTD